MCAGQVIGNGEPPPLYHILGAEWALKIWLLVLKIPTN